MELEASEQITRISQEILRSRELLFGWLFGYFKDDQKNTPVLLSTQLCSHYRVQTKLCQTHAERNQLNHNSKFISEPDFTRDYLEKKASVPSGIDVVGFWFSFIAGEEESEKESKLHIQQLLQAISSATTKDDQQNRSVDVIFAFPIKNCDADVETTLPDDFQPTLRPPQLLGYHHQRDEFVNVLKMEDGKKDAMRSAFETAKNVLLCLTLSPFEFSYYSHHQRRDAKSNNNNNGDDDDNEKEIQFTHFYNQLMKQSHLLQLNAASNPIRLLPFQHNNNNNNSSNNNNIEINNNNNKEGNVNVLGDLLEAYVYDAAMADEEDDDIPEIKSIAENDKEKSKKKGKNAKKKGSKSASAKKKSSAANNNNNNNNNAADDLSLESQQSFQSHVFTSQSVVHLHLTSLPVADDSSLSLSLSTNDTPLYHRSERMKIQVLHYGSKSESVYDALHHLLQRTFCVIKEISLNFSHRDHSTDLEGSNLIFSPPFIPHFVNSIFLFNSKSHSSFDEQNVEVRRNEHKKFLLPLNRPIFRSANAISFSLSSSSSQKSSKLSNVHIGLKESGVKGGVKYLVDGNYDYYHYRQDNFDDEGWGCAYRSMQTICSWLRYQSYTSKEVPSHLEIQQTLVDIGDREKNFLHSKQWIGAIEISYCLNTLYSVECKIQFCNDGESVKDAARVIKTHFQTNGSPIMIGGGVLAYTLLGIDWNEVTGDIKYLILDPHYVGPENTQTIHAKGWCGWKDSSLFKKEYFYNLCMPQRPMIF